jgi:hypothetical protein
MPLRFLCYIGRDGRDVVREWYDALDDVMQGDFIGVLEILQSNNRAKSDKKLFKELDRRASSRCLGLHEILIDRNERHLRIIGFLVEDLFTMLVPFSKERSPLYTRQCAKALERKAEIELDRYHARECEFPPIKD